MLITRVEAGNGKRYRIYSEEQFLFALYGKELKRYCIEEGVELEEDMVDEIRNLIIYKRAKERALFLLEKRPMTVCMLKEKLRKNDYPGVVIDEVVVFLQKYRYLDDEEYIRLYVNSHFQKKSKKQMIFELMQKGVSKEHIICYFEENDYSEQSSFVKQFSRYIRGKNLQDYATRQKVYAYFYNKGFSSSLIEYYIRCERSSVYDE